MARPTDLKQITMITGTNHITFSVKDLKTSFAFYRDILGFKPLARWTEGAYFLAGDTWVCLTLDNRTRTEPLPEYSHIAFSVSERDFPRLSERIVKSGTIIWQDNSSEGASLYFLDPDGHKLELHASDWKSRLEAWRSDTWDDLELFV